MKIEEYQQIVYDSFAIREFAKEEYFKKAQRDSGYSAAVFYSGIMEAISIMTEYLDTPSMNSWSRDENGNRIYNKRAISLAYETNGRINKTIWSSEALNPLRLLIQKLSDTAISPKEERKYTMEEIGILCVYSGKTVTRDNGDEIALEYGFNSGDRLYQHFVHYSHRANRIGTEDSKVKTQNKIKRIRKILPLSFIVFS